MNAVLKSPYDALVEEIRSAPTYLTTKNARELMEIIKETFPTLFNIAAKPVERIKSPHILLQETIVSLNTTIKQLGTAAMLSEDGMNAADLKKLVDAQEKQIRILAKLSETLSANERQDALEGALIESLDDCGDSTFKDTFLSKFHQKLEDKSQQFSMN